MMDVVIEFGHEVQDIHIERTTGAHPILRFFNSFSRHLDAARISQLVCFCYNNP